jgi:hypothetical protein
MPIDYRIIRDSQIQPAPLSAGQIAQQWQSVGAIGRQNQITDRAIQQQDQRRFIAQQNTTPQGFNYQGAAQQSAQAGDFDAAQEYEKFGKANDEYLLKRQAEALKITARTLRDVKTPQEYAYRRQFLLNHGLSQNIPEQYDRQYIETIDRASNDLMDKLKQGWQARSADWNTISAMPEGPEKEAAKQSYLYEWAPSSGYNASPEAINQATKKAVAVETATTGPKARTAAAVETARTTAGAGAESTINQTAIPGFRAIPGVPITNDSVKKVKDAAPTVQTMNVLINEILAKFSQKGYQFTGKDAADYQSKVRNLQLLAKGPELFNLGVLTGPDLRLLEESIPNPASIKEGVKSIAFGDVTTKLNNFKAMLNQRSAAQFRANGFEQEAASGASGATRLVRDPATGKLVRE